MQNRGTYGGVLPPGYDGRTARKPVQRRVVDFTSTVARNLQARAHRSWCNMQHPCSDVCLRPQLRLAQGDGWNDQMLQPALGSAMDVRTP